MVSRVACAHLTQIENGGFGMAFQAACVIDNRDAQEMYGYLEARVEALKHRIAELERENEMLRAFSSQCSSTSPLENA